MKSLNNFQKASKVLKILSQIAFVCSIVGCALCCIGVIVVAVFGNNPSFVEMFVKVGETFNLKASLCVCICGIIQCGFMITLYACTVKFYKKELQIGTPFEKEVTSSCRKLGWIYIILACSSIFVISIVGACFGVDSSSYMSSANLAIGIVYLIVSLIFAYGTDLKNSNTVSTTQATEEISKSQTTTEEK